MSGKPYWSIGVKTPRFPRLDRDLTVDVVVIGAGITGITAAFLLKKAGFKVALVERDRCASGDTRHTTAHLTHVTDLRLHQLVNRFGNDHARAAWDAGRAAIHQIHELVTQQELDCEFAWVPAYLHAPRGKRTKSATTALKRDAQLAAELGFEGQYVDSVPFIDAPGVCFANQAKIQPLKYLAGLLQTLEGPSCHVFEGSEVTQVDDKPLAVKARGYTISCGFVIIATHVPLMGKDDVVGAALFQSKLAPYTSYVVGAKVPRGTIPQALFWDTNDPYHYMRVDQHERHDYVIFGGQDNKTGQDDDPEKRFRNLESLVRTYVPKAEIKHRWLGQVIETNDDLPLIGLTAERQFVATGFAGNGTTFGTLGAMMAVDALSGRKNPWQALFDVKRKKIRGGTWNYIKENLDYPYYMIKDRLFAAESKTLRGLKRGNGKILNLSGQRVAAYRDPAGKVTTLSPTCTHMGCIVHWNVADSTWDCPCHGSRFRATGEVLGGPAETPLEEVKVEKNKS